LEKQKNNGRIVVIDMHATIDPPQAPHKKLSNYMPGLKLADRLLVHSIADMNRLKSYGLIENLVLFPHGILDIDFGPTKQNNIPTIATYGFCLPHKGLEQVLESVGILKNSGILINLRMVNAEYPVDFSADLVSSLRERISQLGLNEQVELESRFLSDDESLSLLHGSDLVVFAYHPTSESASGAVRYGFASGKPTMVTNIPIFDEFGDCVWRVPDNNPETLADAIVNALSEIRNSSPVYIERKQLADNWRDYHKYSRLSSRLQGLLQSLFIQKKIS
jgi:glycosyltransferase involved in cell wall biosynthesis